NARSIMIYILSKVFWAIAQPLNFIVLLVLAWALLIRLGYRKIGGRVLQLALGLLVTVTVLPVGQLLLIPLENRFPRLDPLPEHVTGIIVLGAAIEGDTSLARGMIALNDNAERMTETLALARHYPDATVLFAGGSADIVGSKIPESDYARR